MACVVVALVTSALSSQHLDTETNMKRGLFWGVLVATLFLMNHLKDGPFFRPHPVVWRFVLAASVVYEGFLVFLLFQAPEDGRHVFSFYDKRLGEPLPRESYADNCAVYDPEHKDGPFGNIYNAFFDIFVVAHIFGHWVKAMIFRSYWMSWLLSINFEFLESSLAFQLPNFNECWWDSWLLDAFGCNAIGIYLGMKTCDWLEMRTYTWENFWAITSFRGKIKRAAIQLTPISWEHFAWRPSESLGRWLACLVVMLVCLSVELNAFYLKHVLYIPSYSSLNLFRLCITSPACAVACRELYQYVNDPNCIRFGQQAWMVIVIVITEILIVVKVHCACLFLISRLSLFLCLPRP